MSPAVHRMQTPCINGSTNHAVNRTPRPADLDHRWRLGLHWGENECLRDGIDDQLETADVTTIDYAGTGHRHAGIVLDDALARRAFPRRRGGSHLGAPVYLGSSKEAVRLRTVMSVRIARNTERLRRRNGGESRARNRRLITRVIRRSAGRNAHEGAKPRRWPRP